MPFNLSTGELLVLLIVAILVFGRRLPEVARKVARGVGEFRRGMNEEMRRIEVDTAIEEEDVVPPEWTAPPDGADCDGFGRIEPDEPAEPAEEETPDAAREPEAVEDAAPEESAEERPEKKAP